MSPQRQLGFLWGAVAVAIVAFSPMASTIAARAPACPIRSGLDVPCLSCGTTRAALALASLDLPAALAVNPLATLGWVVLVGGGLLAGGAALLGRSLPLPALRPRPSVRWAAAAGVLANWAYLVFAGV